MGSNILGRDGRGAVLNVLPQEGSDLQRSGLALVITCALILGFGIPLIPLVGVDSAEGTEVSAASDVATVSAENSLQNGSFEQPDVYQYRETSDVPYWKSTATSGLLSAIKTSEEFT